MLEEFDQLLEVGQGLLRQDEIGPDVQPRLRRRGGRPREDRRLGGRVGQQPIRLYADLQPREPLGQLSELSCRHIMPSGRHVHHQSLPSGFLDDRRQQREFQRLAAADRQFEHSPVRQDLHEPQRLGKRQFLGKPLCVAPHVALRTAEHAMMCDRPMLASLRGPRCGCCWSCPMMSATSVRLPALNWIAFATSSPSNPRGHI